MDNDKWDTFYALRIEVMMLIKLQAAATYGTPEADILCHYESLMAVLFEGHEDYAGLRLLQGHIRLARATARRERARLRLEAALERKRMAQMAYDHAKAKYAHLLKS